MEDIHSTLKEGIYVGWLLTMKSEDYFFCCSLLIPKEIFPVAQNHDKIAFFLQMHPPPAAKQKIGSAVSAAYIVSNAETCIVILLKVASCARVLLHRRLNLGACAASTVIFWFLVCGSYPIDSEFWMF